MSPNLVTGEGRRSTSGRDRASPRLLRVTPVSDIEISIEILGAGSCYRTDSEALANVE